MRILVLSMELPCPPNTGGRIRTYNLLRRLAKDHDIHLLSLIQHADEARFVPELAEHLVSVDTVLLRRRSKLGHMPGVLRRILSGAPMDTQFYFLPEMARKVVRALSEHRFDIIQLEHSYMASYLDVIPPGARARRVLTFVDVESVRLARAFKVENNPYWRLRQLINWLPMKRWENAIAANVDMCITTSEVDRARLRLNTVADRVLVVPNGVDCDALKPLPWGSIRRDVLFVGTFGYPPNVDAALYFARDVLPDVVRHIPDARFLLVGSKPPAVMRRLAKNPQIVVTGWVEDVRPYYEQSAVCVVPLRVGGGTRLKILEAMALGRPVVSTSIGCEGLDVTHGVNILIADSARDFAAATVKLLSDGDLRCRLVNNARQLVENTYAWEIIADALARAYEEMVTSPEIGR